MGFFGDIERFLSEDLYPYRWPLFISMLVAIAITTALAYRQGWHRVVWRHRFVSTGAVVLFLVVAAPLGYPLVSPLFERNTVCEASPISGAGTGSERCELGAAVAATNPPGSTAATPKATVPPTPETEAQVIREGEFVGADDFHFGEGKALLIETAPGAYTLRFEEFSVRNGPDLFVYLSTDEAGFSDDALNLGELKGTDGAFNYDVPAGTDVSKFKSAIVWCKDFGVLFATAAFSDS